MDSPSESSPSTPEPNVNSTIHGKLTVQDSLIIIQELIQSYTQNSNAEPKNVWLPRFNPEVAGSDPAVWCAAANRIMEKNPLENGALYSVLINALEGSAMLWLKKVMVNELDITWPKFKELFIKRFGGNESTTWVLMKIMKEQPTKDEHLGAFGLRLHCFLKTRWENLTPAEIINACVLARLSSEDERIKDIALAGNVTNEEEFRSLMRDFSYPWSVPLSNNLSASPEVKRRKLSRSRIKCFYCGVLGHKMAVCRKRIRFAKLKNIQTRKENQPSTSKASYFKCHEEDHAAADRPLLWKRTYNSGSEHRVDACVVEPATVSYIATSYTSSSTINMVAYPPQAVHRTAARPYGLLLPDNIEEREVDISDVRQQAINNIEISAKYDKDRFDKSTAKVVRFNLDDFVLRKNEKRNNQTKLDPKFNGPFVIAEILEGDRYVLKTLDSKQSYKYNHDKLRKMPENCISVGLDVCSDDNGSDNDDISTPIPEDH
ncbi:uncharacterized protein LOC143304054 [Bombus vancouverensis nearcticus]|uniref:uncharacterized protein LOC143304054 n=1 Tax=Bombus vancouverensis nearcticus TaxID=2705178 RepID=UPI00402B9EC8